MWKSRSVKHSGKDNRKTTQPWLTWTGAAEDYPTRVIVCTSEAAMNVQVWVSEINTAD